MRGTDSKERSLSCQSSPGHSVWVPGSSGCEKPPRHGKDCSPCSNGSTFPEDSPREGRKADIWTESSSSMESSRSRQVYRSNRPRSVSVILEWFRPVSHLHGTILAMQSRTMCEMSLVGEQRNDAHSGVDSCRCRFRHHEGSRPVTGQQVLHGEKFPSGIND